MCTYRLLYAFTPDDERAVDDFLQANEGFHYFQAPAYFNVCLKTKRLRPFCMIAKQNDTVVGVLMGYRQLQINLPLIGFLTSRSVIIGGPVVGKHNEHIMNGLLEAYQTQRPKSLYTQIRNLVDTSSFRSVLERNGFIYDDHLDILVDLTQPEAVLWKAVHTKRRNEIRRAEKEGCLVMHQTSPEALEQCYAILTEVYQRAKLPLPEPGHFRAMLDQSTETTGLRLFTAVWNEKIIGCMLCFAWGDTLYDYYAGSYSRYYNKYPNDLLPWDVFRWAKANGFSRFDFGGAGKPGVLYGVRDYKKKFGGTLVNYGRYEQVHYPLLFGLATRLFTLWQRIKP